MPTIVQKIVRQSVVTLLCMFWSLFAIIHLIINLWKYSRQQGIINAITSLFQIKHIEQPKILYSNNWTHRFIQLSQIRMHYVESGDISNPLIVCLHGFPEFWYSYRFQLRHFSKNYHIVALDLRGYGDTDKPIDVEQYDIDLISNDVVEFIQKAGKKAILIGHDWGAAVAWTVAMHNSELIADRLVILNVPHPKAFVKVLRTKSAQLWKSWYIFMFQCPILPEINFRAMNFKFLHDILRKKPLGIQNSRNFTDEDMEAWKYTFSKPNAITPIINYYRRLMTTAGEKNFSSELIKPKTLIIWGEKDVALDIYGAKLSLTLCCNARLEKIPNASHWVQQDVPEIVNALIENFIQY